MVQEVSFFAFHVSPCSAGTFKSLSNHSLPLIPSLINCYVFVWFGIGCTTTGNPASSLGLDSIGDYFISVQKGQQRILIFEQGKQHPKFRCSIPEKMSSCALDTYGEYLFAGSHSGKLYCWKVRVIFLFLFFF